MLPRHVNPVVPAHVPSELTFRVEVGVALVDVLVVLLVVVVVDFVEEEATLDELEEVFTELELDEPPEQVPPTGLHPVPQYALVLPQ